MNGCEECQKLELLRRGLAREFFEAAIELHALHDSDAAKAVWFVAVAAKELDRICGEHEALHLGRQTVAGLASAANP